MNKDETGPERPVPTTGLDDTTTGAERLRALEARYDWLTAGQELTRLSIRHLAGEREKAEKRRLRAASDVDRMERQLADLRDLLHRRDAEADALWRDLIEARHEAQR